MEHESIQTDLARQLVDIGGIPGQLVVTEKAIHHSDTSGWRRPDVKLATHPEDFRGVAFEIKTSTTRDARVSLLRQLFTYRIEGWHPVLVTSKEIFESRPEGKISIQEIRLYLRASYVCVSEGSPPSFEIVLDATPDGSSLPHPIGDNQYPTWFQGSTEQ